MAITCSNCKLALTPQQAGRPCPECGSMDRSMTAEDRAVLGEEKARVAKDLAKRHYESETGLTKIIRLSGGAEVEVTALEPIKLLEVNENTFASGIRPLQFGPAPASGVMFPSVIVEVTPDEFNKIQTEELKLPRGWVLGEELPKPPAEGGGD